MCYRITKGQCKADLNEKDMDHLLRLVRADLRYLRGRGRDPVKIQKRSELERKLAQIARKR